MVWAGVCVLGGSALAGPITYTESGTLSGSLGATTLTNVSFTFVFNGDTANIVSGNPLLNPATSNSISIGAFNGSFTTAVEVGVGAAGIIGFTDLSENDGITFSSAGAVGYNLAAPITVTAPTSHFASGSLETSLGTLAITGAQNLSFTATLVPEPASMSLLGLSLLGLTSLRLRRKST